MVELECGGLSPGQGPGCWAALPPPREMQIVSPGSLLSPGVAGPPTIPAPMMLCLFLTIQESKLESQ